MPEEINRLVTDAIADLLWTPSTDADANLLNEGVPAHKIQCVGNIMIDSLEMLRERIELTDTASALGLDGRHFAVATLHRPSNVDDRDKLAALVGALSEVGEQMPVVFPIHPRTRKRLAEFDLLDPIRQQGIVATEPLGYIEFMSLIRRCTLAITDSGGIQEETTYLGIPCATLRENTERPITVSQGSNRLLRPEDLATGARDALEGRWRTGSRPHLWDGHTAARAAASLRDFLV